MTWHSSELLWMLLLVPVLAGLLFLGFRLRHRALREFGDETQLTRLTLGRSSGLRATRAVLLLLGIACAVIALARPQYGSRTRMLRKRGIDVVIALDFSKSMLARDVRPSRIDRAKAEVTAFLNELSGDRVGIVAFAGETMEFPMTVDYGAAAIFFRDLGPYDMPVGGTAIGRALTSAQRLLERSSRSEGKTEEPQRSKVVILMTDGEDHEGDPVAAATELAKSGAKVFVVGIGTRTGEPIPTYADDGTWTGYLRDAQGNSVLTSLSADNEAQLKQIASASGGKYFAAGRGSVGMNQIRSEMQHMKQSELKSRKITVHEERYAPILLVAFLLVLLEALLPEARFLRRNSAGSTTLMLLGLFGTLALAGASSPARADFPGVLHTENSAVQSGNAALLKGDAKSALQEYERAARQLPDAPGVQLNRGIALLKQGDYGKAREALLAATAPSGASDVRADAYHNLALSFYREADGLAGQDKHAEAQKLFRESVDAAKRSLHLRPNDHDVAWNLELAARRVREEEQKQKEQEQKDKDKDKDKEKDKDNQDQNQDKQSGDQNDQQKPDEQQKSDSGDDKDKSAQQKPEDKPKQDQPEPKQDKQPQEQAKKDSEPAEQEPSPSDKKLPQEASQALDSLKDGEENFERYRARQRASHERRAPEKDW